MKKTKKQRELPQNWACAVSKYNRVLAKQNDCSFEGSDTPMHTMDIIKTSSLNINQTNNKTSDTASKVCIKYFNYGQRF